MTQNAEILIAGFSFNTQIITTQLADLTDELSASRIGEGNCVWWILGHLCASRLLLLRSLGQPRVPSAWEQYFLRGASGIPHPDWPTMQTLATSFSESGSQITNTMQNIPAPTWETVEPHPALETPSTLAQNSTFLYFHEGYHLGQIGLLRRQLGLSGIA